MDRSTVWSLVRGFPEPVLLCGSELEVLGESRPWVELWGGPSRPGQPYVDVYEQVLPLRTALREALLGTHPVRRDPTELGTHRGPHGRWYVTLEGWLDGDGCTGGVWVRTVQEERSSAPFDVLTAAVRGAPGGAKRFSHDLRAPIRIARGLVDLVSLDIEEGQLKRAALGLERVQKKLASIDGMVQRVLELMEVDAARSPTSTVDLSKVVQDVLEAQQPALRGVGMEVSRGLEWTSLRVDETRLHRVLLHLVSNAVQFADEDEEPPWLSIESRRVCEELWVDLSDNGLGFEEPERAFELFHRESPERSGPGFGLYIANQHMKSMGGVLDLVSARKPTILRLRWPAARHLPDGLPGI